MGYTDDVLQNRTLETHVILLSNVTPINLIKKINKKVNDLKKTKTTR